MHSTGPFLDTLKTASLLSKGRPERVERVLYGNPGLKY